MSPHIIFLVFCFCFSLSLFVFVLSDLVLITVHKELIESQKKITKIRLRQRFVMALSHVRKGAFNLISVTHFTAPPTIQFIRM